jgi:hypothetical protein
MANNTDQDQDQAEYHTTRKNVSSSSTSKPFIALVALLIVAGGSFYGGTAYEKSHDKTSTTGSSALTGFSSGASGGRTGGFRMGGFGTVTAVSSSSIAIQNPRSGTSNTYTIDGSTVIEDSGSTGSLSDIATGDTVMIRTSSSTSTTAAQIDVNPSFGGGQGGGMGAPTSSNSSSSSST